ncbi:MAG TPA: lysophospholipid acyltransferase family protein [Acidimicrobiales bacterium]|nr:lysophospholipid acyltransferase family protein [Acidimicrobiales bacterium]
MVHNKSDDAPGSQTRQRTSNSGSKKPNLGVHYDTEWTRTRAATILRNLVFSTVIGPVSRFICSPSLHGLEQINAESQPLIFAPNHVSHFDTLAFLCTIPPRYRKKLVVAAAVDNFFDKRWKCLFFSLFLSTIPVERTRTNRKSADIAAALIERGYSLLIFPEGGRSFTDEMMDFHGGAAYLAKRCSVPVVPVYLKGVRRILPKGSSRVHRAPIDVFLGPALRPYPGQNGEKPEDARRFIIRIQDAIVELGAKKAQASGDASAQG